MNAAELLDARIAAARIVLAARRADELGALRALYDAARERDPLKLEDAVFAVARAQTQLALVATTYSGLLAARASAALSDVVK